MSEPSLGQMLPSDSDGGIASATPTHLTHVDLESFVAGGLLDPVEMQRLRKSGLTGRAYFRYLKALDIDSEQLMAQLAACGVSSYTYESFLNLGVTDVLRVCRLHLEGWTADSYDTLLREIRESCGRALYKRLLSCHHAPVVTLSYVKSSVRFADWLLYLSEEDLEPVVAKCEADHPGITYFFEECDL